MGIRQRNALRAHYVLRDGPGRNVSSEDLFQICESSDNPRYVLEVKGNVVGEHFIEGREVWNPGEGAGIRYDAQVGKTFRNVEDIGCRSETWNRKREKEI